MRTIYILVLCEWTFVVVAVDKCVHDRMKDTHTRGVYN